MDVFNSFKKCPNNLFFADIFTCRCKQLAIYLVTFISVSTLNIYWPERNADLRCFSYFFKPYQSGRYVLCTSLYTCTLCPEKTYMFWSFKSRENVNINFLLINIIADIMLSSTDFLILLILNPVTIYFYDCRTLLRFIRFYILFFRFTKTFTFNFDINSYIDKISTFDYRYDTLFRKQSLSALDKYFEDACEGFFFFFFVITLTSSLLNY